MDFAVAVKSFIVDDEKLLTIKRRPDDVHRPSQWDIPGGRLELGENPFDGIKREVKEEVGVDVDVVAPLEVQHFTRDDGQKITMIIFLCAPLSKQIKLSKEHTEYEWMEIGKAEENVKWLHNTISNFNKYFKGKI